MASEVYIRDWARCFWGICQLGLYTWQCTTGPENTSMSRQVSILRLPAAQQQVSTDKLTDCRIRRKLVACARLCVHNGRRMFYRGHKSNLGDQDPPHVTELEIGQRRLPGSVAVPKHLGRSTENVQERGYSVVLFRPDTGSAGFDARRNPVSAL